MSTIAPSTPLQHHPRPGKPGPRKPDQRVQRTRARLGSAFIELLHERAIEDITIQDVLNRASVGRSTFYLHFRDKNDLLLSQLEMFCEMMSTQLSVNKERSHRVVPVEEMFAHIAGAKKFYRILADADRLNDFYELAQGYFARGIELRLIESRRLTKVPQPEIAMRATALAGSLLSLLRSWLDRGAKETPRAMDDLFHKMVWTGCQ